MENLSYSTKPMSDKPQEKIDILSVTLLDQHRPLVTDLKKLASSLSLGFGWHYLLDLSWIISHLGNIQGKSIMDAGAGLGVLQWYLAKKGAEVLSVDRNSRAGLPSRFRTRFRIQWLRPENSFDLISTFKMMLASFMRIPGIRGKIAFLVGELIHNIPLRRATGKIIFYNQDLKNLIDVPDNTLDAVAAVSALEHNPPEELEMVVAEIMRVLKPGGLLLATLGAAKDQDWFHEPSQGWCYTEETLRRVFGLEEDTPSNYAQYDELFTALHDCAELRDNLASFYFQSGDNGMPWGVWNPQYQSVGVCKIKKE